MKVGTDGVLLGAWCRVAPPHEVAMLDIGTGTGVIALQLAQRTAGIGTACDAVRGGAVQTDDVRADAVQIDDVRGDAVRTDGVRIDAVEIDARACITAARNFAASAWSDRLKVYNADIKDFASDAARRAKYDHIVSNPPYFIGSLASPHAGRNTARHAVSVSYGELMECCALLLKPSGRVSLIVPAGAETDMMVREAARCGFVVSRRTDVHSTPTSGPKRTLLEFSRLQSGSAERAEWADRTVSTEPTEPTESTNRALPTDNVEPSPRTTIVIEDGGAERFSEEYRALTRDFYLRF